MSTTRASRFEHRSAVGSRPGPRGTAFALLLVSTVLIGGCLGKPTVEDRWTRIDIDSASLSPGQTLPGGTTQPITVSTHITYRSIITGFAVAELRSSNTLTAADVTLRPDAPRPVMAEDIDRVLDNSVTLGRATRGVTGWDHLIQHIDFSFNGVTPAALDTAAATTGTPAGLFLVCYLGAGDKVERQDGTDTLVVTPFRSSQYQILPIGMALAVGPPPPRSQ